MKNELKLEELTEAELDILKTKVKSIKEYDVVKGQLNKIEKSFEASIYGAGIGVLETMTMAGLVLDEGKGMIPYVTFLMYSSLPLFLNALYHMITDDKKRKNVIKPYFDSIEFERAKKYNLI